MTQNKNDSIKSCYGQKLMCINYFLLQFHISYFLLPYLICVPDSGNGR